MTDLTPETRARLTALALAATPGPWREGIDGNNRVYGPDGSLEHSGPIAEAWKGRANVSYLAAASPDVLLAYERALGEAEREIARLLTRLELFHERWERLHAEAETTQPRGVDEMLFELERAYPVEAWPRSPYYVAPSPAPLPATQEDQ